MPARLEDFALVFHEPDCGGLITGAVGRLRCEECGRRFTIETLREQFSAQVNPDLARAVDRF
ncbi:MAG TPA: hypothetical protein VHZ55_12180 [Bryobacteraceae bacterium]|jgi:hypothetical protein|nr:hypothetical protein [Bryobacteraceae bacterium]